MNSIQKRIERLEEKRQQVLEGKFSYLPFRHHFPKLAKYVPGIFKEGMYAAIAGTGDGKTKFTKYMTVILPYILSKKIGTKFKTIYFALEESEEEFIDHIILLLLKEQHNLNIDYLELNSYRAKPVSDHVMECVRQVSAQAEEIMQNIFVYDDISNPTGMYLKCKEHARQWGRFIEHDNGTKSYIPNDPDEIVIVVTDHVSLITQEYDSILKQTLSKHQSLAKWSSTYCLKYITKQWKWAVWNVQQTTMTSEGLENKKTHTLEPSMEDLATNKELARDYKVMFTLFNPFKHKKATYRGYDITKLKYRFRNLGIIKNRYGLSPVNIGLHFDGVTGKYTELEKEN